LFRLPALALLLVPIIPKLELTSDTSCRFVLCHAVNSWYNVFHSGYLFPPHSLASSSFTQNKHELVVYMELSQALENIKQIGDNFAKDEVLCIRENKDTAIPVLLDIVRNIADNFDEIPESTEDITDPAYAMFLLAEFKVHEAFDPIIRLLELEEDECDWLLGDMITCDMDSIIASIATAGDIKRIKAVVENSTLNEFQRYAALKALTIMYSEGIYPRAELVDYLGNLLERFADDEDFISWIVGDCKDISATEHYARIRNLFKNNKVDTSIIGVKHFAEDAPLVSEEEVLKRIKEDPYTKIITDTIESMNWWACFKENQKPFVPKLPATGNKKVGRNELCPCGSGKKYKKCCLNK